MTQIGFVGGTSLLGNVRTFLSNIRPLLPDDVRAELIIVSTDVRNIPDGYERVDSGL